MRVDEEAFEAFVMDAEPRLRRALVALRGVDEGREAVAEALAWAFEHWDRVQTMENPIGYLFRVGQSRTRPRRRRLMPAAEPFRIPDVEPALPAALAALTEHQRNAVWLVHGCDWSYADTAKALGISVSAVGTHASRALEHLRRTMEVELDA
jgi:DNA-directed RNA polymerase specialized sigma24 family protein